MLTITKGQLKGLKSTESQIKEVVVTNKLLKEIQKDEIKAKKIPSPTVKIATPKVKDVKKPSKVVTIQAKAVTLDQIKEVIKLGTMTLTTEKKMTDTIVSDLFNMKGNDSILTLEVNRIIKEGRDSEVASVKKWVKTRLQTLIKEGSVQDRVLGDKVKDQQITIKRVTKPMVADKDGIYLDSFNESDLGQYKAVKIRKVKNEDTLEESLMKWMRSQKLHDKESDDYETETVRALLDNIDKGIV